MVALKCRWCEPVVVVNWVVPTSVGLFAKVQNEVGLKRRSHKCNGIDDEIILK